MTGSLSITQYQLAMDSLSSITDSGALRLNRKSQIANSSFIANCKLKIGAQQ